MGSGWDAVGGERRSDAARLAVLDVAVVVGLVLVGRFSHGGYAIADPLGVIEAVAPFVIGWSLVSIAAGLYRRPDGDPIAALRRTAVCWLAASNVGFLIRGSPYVDGRVPWTFMVVFVGFGLLAFAVVRVGYALALDS